MTEVRSSPVARAEDLAWAGRLAWFTIVYNILEGAVSIAFGIADESLALAGFGADSLIEVGSAVLVLWRLRAEGAAGSCDATSSLDRERAATKGIGALFLLLAVVTVAGALFRLGSGSHPRTTLPGLAISALSLSFMFYLWSAKLRVARDLDSAVVLKDAACSLACIQLSGVLFLGSLVYLVRPALWWADTAAALAIAAFIAQEGIETVRAASRPDFTGGCGCSGVKEP